MRLNKLQAAHYITKKPAETTPSWNIPDNDAFNNSTGFLECELFSILVLWKTRPILGLKSLTTIIPKLDKSQVSRYSEPWRCIRGLSARTNIRYTWPHHACSSRLSTNCAKFYYDTTIARYKCVKFSSLLKVC